MRHLVFLYFTDWFAAVQAMESIGLLLLFVGVILLEVYIFCQEDNTYIKYFAMGFLFTAGTYNYRVKTVYKSHTNGYFNEKLVKIRGDYFV